MWITARDFLKFVESEKYVWTQKERMEGYLDALRKEEKGDSVDYGLCGEQSNW